MRKPAIRPAIPSVARSLDFAPRPCPEIPCRARNDRPGRTLQRPIALALPRPLWSQPLDTPSPAPLVPVVPAPPPSRIFAWVAMAVLLLLVLYLKLLPALLSGLLVYQLVHMLAPMLGRRVPGERARLIAVAMLAAVIVGLVKLAIIGCIAFFRSDAGSMAAL